MTEKTRDDNNYSRFIFTTESAVTVAGDLCARCAPYHRIKCSLLLCERERPFEPPACVDLGGDAIPATTDGGCRVWTTSLQITTPVRPLRSEFLASRRLVWSDQWNSDHGSSRFCRWPDTPRYCFCGFFSIDGLPNWVFNFLVIFFVWFLTITRSLCACIVAQTISLQFKLYMYKCHFFFNYFKRVFFLSDFQCHTWRIWGILTTRSASTTEKWCSGNVQSIWLSFLE